jgi:hypothetical protein
MRSPLLLVVALAGFLSSCSTFDKDPKVLITVFSQGNDMDSPKTIFRRTIEGRTMVLKVIPEFTHKSIVAFHPFPAADGTNGVALKLDFKGTNALEIVTRMRQGEMLVSMVNAAVVDYVSIDGVISDGIFTIWRGLPDELIAAMDEEYPRISELKASGESSSDMLEMLPSTSTEKRQARKRAEKGVIDKAKEEAEAAKPGRRGGFDPEPPAGSVVPLSEALNSDP